MKSAATSKVGKHTVITANEALEAKGFSSFLRAMVVDHDKGLITLLDKTYGVYNIDLKALCENSSIPLHKLRKRQESEQKTRDKYVGKTINNVTVLDLFYGPSKGYKNKSFYLECLGICGHKFIVTYAALSRHRKNFYCLHCRPSLHGERKRIEGVLKKRSPTYAYWIRHKKKLPQKYYDFVAFKEEVGERPNSKSVLVCLDGNFLWKDLSCSEDREIQLIATSLRQAFRHSQLYKDCIASARVETEFGPRYKCAECYNLSKRGMVQVDHVDPVKPLDGSPLTKENVLERVWTANIQVLDRKCHTRKSTTENAQRRITRKENKK